MPTCRASEPRGGFTLLEVLIAFTLLAGMFAVALSTFSGSSQQLNQSLAIDQMQLEAARALNQLVTDLKATDRGHVAISAGQVSVFRVSHWDALSGAEEFEAAAFVYRVAGGELLHDHPVYTGRPRVLARGVTAFTVTPEQAPLTDETITVSLTLARQVGVGPDGTPQTRATTVSRTIFVRPVLD
ncbi:MAG: hypothetical protein KIT58_15895 [Planctomycetota bacterium]|nr:hypothetical protein [Planctomycetota bacterium]